MALLLRQSTTKVLSCTVGGHTISSLGWVPAAKTQIRRKSHKGRGSCSGLKRPNYSCVLQIKYAEFHRKLMGLNERATLSRRAVDLALRLTLTETERKEKPRKEKEEKKKKQKKKPQKNKPQKKKVSDAAGARKRLAQEGCEFWSKRKPGAKSKAKAKTRRGGKQ